MQKQVYDSIHTEGAKVLRCTVGGVSGRGSGRSVMMIGVSRCVTVDSRLLVTGLEFDDINL